MPGPGERAEPLAAAQVLSGLTAASRVPDAEAVGLAKALESERAARSALTDQLEQSRREAERLLVQRQALEREVTALQSASRGASSVQRSEYTSNLLEATAEAVFWRNSCEAAEARAVAAETDLRALRRRMAAARAELDGLRSDASSLRTSARAEVEAASAEARSCLQRAGAALAAERAGRAEAEACARQVFAALADSAAGALKGAVEWSAPGSSGIGEPLTSWPVGVVLDLPASATGAVVGRGGSVVKGLQATYGVCVQIDGPDKHGDGGGGRGADHGRCIVTITGGSCSYNDVGAAAEALVRAFREEAQCRASVLVSRAGPAGSSGDSPKGMAAALALVRSASGMHVGEGKGRLCLTAARMTSFKAAGPLAALTDAVAVELAANSCAALALALDALRAAAAEGGPAAAGAAAAGAAAGAAGAGWVVAAATLPSREVGRLVGKGGETAKRIAEAVDGVLVADAFRPAHRGSGASPDHTACVVGCPAAKLAVAGQEIGRAASNATSLARESLSAAAMSAAQRDVSAAMAAAGSASASSGAAAAGAAGSGSSVDVDTSAVFFRPEGVAGYDGVAGLSAVLEPVARAARTVDVAVYGLTDDTVRNSLMAAHQRGVRVRVIVDKEQAEEPGADAKWLAEQGVQVAEAPGSEDGRLFHHKVIVADGAVLVTGSLNLTKHASHANWENMVVTAEQAAVAAFQAEFERLWALCGPDASPAARRATLLASAPDAEGALTQAASSSAAATGGGFSAGQTESIFFPCGEEGLKRLCKYLSSAKTVLSVAALALTSDRVREAVQARHAAGVQVRVLADRSKSTEPGSDLAWLSKQSVPVRCARPTGDESSLFHHKFFVVDDHTVVTGSFNLTASAAERNFESVIVMASKGAAARYAAEFNTLWEAAAQL